MNIQFKIISYVKGDLSKLYRYNKKINVNELKIKPPILEQQLIDNVIKNTYLFAKNSRRMRESGIRLRRGIILQGSPGNGKTMLCSYVRALCEKENITTKMVDSNKIRSAYSQNKLEALFTCADVIFFDDIDVTFLSRTSGTNGEIATSILSSMDGIDNERNCIVRIFTTNEDTDNLDAAFMRPGRIDARFTINKPDKELRHQLIKSWPKSLLEHVDIDELIKITHDLSFSQIEEIRSKMTINYYIEGKWDFDNALREFEKYNEQFSNSKKVGF